MRARQQKAALSAADDGGGGTSLTAPWTFIGPSNIQTGTFGTVSGRVTSIAVDPSDPSGNTVYVGTTGGGVWKSTNAAGPASLVTFQPLTDNLPAFSSGSLASLSIGALSVRQDGGVILAGTGDPNDATDSYFGTGILRSTDGGNTWSLIQISDDAETGGYEDYSFVGEGFAGFAWSTANPHLVVAAVTQSAEGTAVNARVTNSYAGLYYSTNDGQTWQLATITDGSGKILQSPTIATGVIATGNSATSVTWNPVRQRFYAAIRYHGYYESTDGITFTRLANQPGAKLSSAQCPANSGGTGSVACPIYRGVITTQPVTGDMFALTVADASSGAGVWQDQGLWQDLCSSTGNGCTTSPTVTFSTQIADAAIEDGHGNIAQGDYNLTLAAVPSQQDTLLFVGTEDIFRCSLADSCAWRNTTNSNNCAAAEVASSEHAIDATFGTNGLMYFGNDGGLWRTTDDVGQQQAQCSFDDATHFQNLNGGMGSLAEVTDFSVHPTEENTMMAAMGAFGTAAPQSGSSTWAQILDGEGDGNAIDPVNPQNWYATSAAPVSINACAQGAACDKDGFGLPEIGNAQIADDGLGLVQAAPWILDPQNPANMIVGTCRVWRGPAANGSAWNANNALSGMLDTIQNPFCEGNAPIEALAASGSPGDAPGAAEKIYAGLAAAGSVSPTSIGGHIYGASIGSAAAGVQAWSDLSQAPVTNSAVGFNPAELGISSIYVDPHDAQGNTVYVTLQGFIGNGINGALVYRTIDGGASWTNITSNLPNAPANSVVVDPNDRNTVYVAQDTGVYVTRNIESCEETTQSCWSLFGRDLPNAPVTKLRVFNYQNTSYLRAATYGRGIWEVPLATSQEVATTAALNPDSLSFADQKVTTSSAQQTMTLTNQGTTPLNVTGIKIGADFAEQDNCTQAAIAPAGTCSIQVSFVPTQTGPIEESLAVLGNVPTGQVTATLSGKGLASGNITLTPTSLGFGNVLIGAVSPAQNITISNIGVVPINLQSLTASGDFQISANTCGASLAPDFGCTVSITFTPTVSGARAGVFSLVSDNGTQTVQLSGTGQAKATAVLSASSLNFSTPQTVGTKSDAQQVTLTNNGDISLTDISVGTSGDFTYVNSCGASLIGHGTCAISVIYVPTQIGPVHGLLTVATALGTQTVSLSGTGIAPPGISVTPETVDFGSQGVAVTSALQQVTLTNNGGSDLTGLSFAVANTSSDAGANEFALAGGSCPSSNVLGAGESCYINVSFTPKEAGERSGTLTVRAANLNQPFNIALAGTGEDFQLQVDGPSSAVIVSGQPATYKVQILPVPNSVGTVYLSCTGAPQNSSCALNPASVAIEGDTPQFSTITVATGSGSTAFLHLWQRAGITLAALLPCLFFGGRRRKILLRTWLACFVALLLALPTACGTHATGGGSSNPSGPSQGGGTTSTITITASTTNDPSKPALQRQVQLTLTVQ